MNTKSLAFSLLLIATQAARASIIGDLAAAVPEHTFVKMPANVSLSALGMESSLLYYGDSGVWDPVDQEIAYVGGPGTCCADPAIYKRVSYSVASNTWSIANAPFTGSGHGYDANALDPRTGAHYFAYFSDKVLHKWNGKSWSDLPPHTLSGSECCVSLSWFPDLNKGNGGLFLQVGSGLAAWFDGTAWNTIPKPSTLWGEYEGFSEYNPVLKSVWVGGGTGADNASFLLDANLKYTRLKDAPISLTTNNSVKSVDPVSGKFIVYSMEDSTFWEYDAQKDVWTKLTPPSMPNLGKDSVFQVPIPSMGVILFFKLDGKTPNVYLYRHTPGVGVVAIRTPVRTEAPRILASADPSGSLMTLTVSSALSGTLTIHDSQGRLAASWPKVSSYPISWDVSNARGGVYLARFQGQGTTSTQRIVVPR